MEITGILICVLVVLDVVVVAALGRFLTLFDRDDPDTFSEVATPEEILLGQSGFHFLGSMKFLFFYVIPRSYEFWSLTQQTRLYADRLRWLSIVVVLANVAVAFYILFSIT